MIFENIKILKGSNFEYQELSQQVYTTTWSYINTKTCISIRIIKLIQLCQTKLYLLAVKVVIRFTCL